MKASDKSSVPAATVLYWPDPPVLDTMLSALDRNSRRLFIFINSPLSLEVEARLATLKNARLIRSSDNVGLGAALNAVTEAAAAEDYPLLLLLDQDSEPLPDMPERLASRFADLDRGQGRLAAIAPLLVTPPDGNYRPMRYDWKPGAGGDIPNAAHFLPTSGSVISIDAWQKVGEFRADYFIGGIDVEWGFRAWHHGFASAVAIDIPMVHRWGEATSDKMSKVPQVLRQSDVRNYYFFRNAIDCLKLPHIPIAWRLRYAIRIGAQGALRLTARRFDAKCRRIVWCAFVSGWRGNLGPIPSQLSDDN